MIQFLNLLREAITDIFEPLDDSSASPDEQEYAYECWSQFREEFRCGMSGPDMAAWIS